MESKDQIKEAFFRIKQDISDLKDQILTMSNEIIEIKRTINNSLNPLNKVDSTYNEQIQTNQQEYPTYQNNPTDNLPLEAVKTPNFNSSTGNEGVPTDRQTNQQTDNYAQFFQKNNKIEEKTDKISHIDRVSELLNSLDSLKKDIRSQFKKLTKQEMLIFSSIYQLEEEGFVVDYSILASKLALSESSIRDYVLRIIKKGIPLKKTKENNKKVIISVQKELKKLASLQTILALREI